MRSLDRALQERLLGRAECEVLTASDRRRLSGQRVLVSGAGGSVGSELARQLAASGVSRLTLMDHSEYALFLVESDIHRTHPHVDVVPMLGDVTRRVDVQAAYDVAEPNVVYHAAAYKHVTYAETAIVQALRVNVVGAAEMVHAAHAARSRFVFISSDKAAQPRSVMGATKRFAEHVVLAEATARFQPIVVRFGNILGSSGSVAEILIDRAEAGHPLPITHPDASRFFMTAGEAVSLVLKADLIGRRPEIFWLDMGEPVRIGDLAARVAEYVQSRGGPVVRTEIIGLRPGEKMHEELTSQGLSMQRTEHARILGARQPASSPAAARRAVNVAARACTHGDAAGALAVLRQLVDDYVPSAAAVAHAARPVRRRHMTAA